MLNTINLFQKNIRNYQFISEKLVDPETGEMFFGKMKVNWYVQN